MNYSDAIDWLEKIPISFNSNYNQYEFKLNSINNFLKHLGNPQNSLKFIHVGGTNGKGTTCHLLSSVLQEHKYNVGLFTSPHILDFRERIKINSVKIDKKFLIDFIIQNKDYIIDNKLSFFEISFALSLKFFQFKKVDFAIIEVGLGGRLDSTNIIKPIVSIITNIGYDHKKFLGDTLEKIAVEKSGIIKYKTPIVSGEDKLEIQNIFKEIAKKNFSPIYFCDSISDFKSDLEGPFIKKNISLVIKVLDLIETNLNHKKKVKGFLNVKRNTKFFGRWELVKKTPKVIYDVGHNISALSESLFFLENNSRVVFGTLEKKDQIDVLRSFPKDLKYYFCPVKSNRGMSIAKLCKHAKNLNLDFSSHQSVDDALSQAIKESNDNDTILVTGSTFLFTSLYA